MKTLNTILAVVAIALLGSCSKSDSTPTTPAGKDIYFAGFQINSEGKFVAKYWKNGTAISLTDGSKSAEAYAISVVGTDVYVAGLDFNRTRDVAKYWKNGVGINIATDVSLNSLALAMFIPTN